MGLVAAILFLRLSMLWNSFADPAMFPDALNMLAIQWEASTSSWESPFLASKMPWTFCLMLGWRALVSFSLIHLRNAYRLCVPHVSHSFNGVFMVSVKDFNAPPRPRLALSAVLGAVEDKCLVVIGIVCSSFVLVSSGVHGRTPFCPLGNTDHLCVRTGNVLASRTLGLLFLHRFHLITHYHSRWCLEGFRKFRISSIHMCLCRSRCSNQSGSIPDFLVLGNGAKNTILAVLAFDEAIVLMFVAAFLPCFLEAACVYNLLGNPLRRPFTAPEALENGCRMWPELDGYYNCNYHD